MPLHKFFDYLMGFLILFLVMVIAFLLYVKDRVPVPTASPEKVYDPRNITIEDLIEPPQTPIIQIGETNDAGETDFDWTTYDKAGYLVDMSLNPGSTISGIISTDITVKNDFYNEFDGVSVGLANKAGQIMEDPNNMPLVVRAIDPEIAVSGTMFTITLDTKYAVKGEGFIRIMQSDGTSGRYKSILIPVIFK